MFDHRIVEARDGVRIEGAGAYVTVRLRPWLLEVTGAREEEHLDLLCPLSRLSRCVARMLLQSATATYARQTAVLERTAWAIAPGLYPHLERLRGMADPRVIAVHNATRAVSRRSPRLAGSEALYRETYVVSDIVNYRAAAIALVHLEEELWPHFSRQRFGGETELTDELATEAMRNWRGLYSPHGAAYRSLNRTLMNVSERIAPRLLCQLRHVELRRPIFDLLELAALVLRARNPGANDEARRSQIHIFQFARATEIEAAVLRIAGFTLRRLNPRRYEDLRVAVQFVSDYPHPYSGRLGGLVERTILWHRRLDGAAEVMAAFPGGTQPATRPPIPLPVIPGIRFLSTVGAIVEEGQSMHHCIATYAQRAVSGQSFLFHVDHAGHQASVEVDRKGTIGQAAGPRNTVNPAVVWGTQQLRSWAAPMRPPRRSRPRRRTVSGQLELPFQATA